MNSLIYFGVVVAGAVTLLIEAYRNYNSSLTSIPFREHPILRNVEVAKLCTPREKNIGFMFYSLLYLGTYIVVLSSTEIYELVTQTLASNSEVGPTDDLTGTATDPIGLIDSQYGRPIFISAAIISIFSIGALRPVENTMRSLSHRLAGVPRGVYAVIEELHAIAFQNFKVECQKPLSDMFTQNVEEDFKNSYDSSQIPAIHGSLRTIDYLAPAITGKQRVKHFPFTQLEKMGELSETLEGQVEDLKNQLKNEVKGDEAARKKIFDMANAVANDTIALFAVHFLRNNRAIKNYNSDSAIARINERIKRSYQVELNSFAMGMMFSTLAIPAAFYTLLAWNSAEYPITASRLQPIVVETMENQQFDAELIETCKSRPPAPDEFDEEDDPWDKIDPAVGSLDPPKAEKCRAVWKSTLKTKYAERRHTILTVSFWEVFGVFMSTLLAAITALFGREVRKEDNSWPGWHIRRIPFLRLFSMAVIPSIAAIFGVIAGTFLELWINAGFALTENQIAFFFQSKWSFFAMHAGVGFIVAIGVLVLIDQHDELRAFVTIPMGVLFAFMSLGWYYLIVIASYGPGFIRDTPPGFDYSFEVREMLIYGAHPFLFLIFFAIFLEITEDSPAQKTKKRRLFNLKKASAE
ncbi:hypothetical protein ACOTTU_07205 [Roseobacter sp. EG26]|uniref:hypothetical protein n=1 Tax=Roseobacter sp. EG26 TaxID=3412477 RepID=UPI0026095361|nr:hypothetical protein [uncultured Roseobacter sp.]